MYTKKVVPALALPLMISLGVTGCGTPAPVDPAPIETSAAPAAAEPIPSATANAPEADDVLLISATATATNGSQLALATQVHLPIPYDDVAGQTLPKAMIDDCGADLTENILKAQVWSFTRVNTSALAVEGTAAWPTNARVDVRPSTAYVSIAGRGMFLSDETTGKDACHQEKYFTGTGNGGLAVGIPGDTVDDASRFTRWTAHSYGFVTPAGVTLSNCTFQVLDLAKQYGAETAGWTMRQDASACVIGPATETAAF